MSASRHHYYMRGITLVELMVTLAVLAIIVSIATAVPDILDKRKAIGAQETVYTELQFARSEAIKQSRDIYVDVGSGDDWCIGVTDKPACNCADSSDACTIRYGGSDVLRVVDGGDFDGVSMDATTSGVVFDGVRGMTRSGIGSMTFTSASGDTLGVVVSNTGRVRFCGEDGGYGACP